MFGRKAQEIESLKNRIVRLEIELVGFKEDLEDMTASRKKWRAKASNLRRERRHLVQQLQLQAQGENQ